MNYEYIYAQTSSHCMTLRNREDTRIERGSTRLPSLKTSLWKRLQTCCKTDYMIMMMMMMMMMVMICTKIFNSKNRLKQS